MTIELDEQLLSRVHQHAAAQGIPVDALVTDALRQFVDSPAKGLLAFIERAEREGWRSNGSFLTDEEMYSR